MPIGITSPEAEKEKKLSLPGSTEKSNPLTNS
jgi:hypothetical protein